MEGKIKKIVAQIMAMLAAGKYEQIVALTHGVRLSAEEIGNVLQDYGGEFIEPPDRAYSALDIVKVKTEIAPDKYSVQMPLWTSEEGMSDLTMDITIEFLNAKIKVELNDIHML